MMRTVCVDFDGVIHAYSRGWLDGSIYDEPVPGAFHALGKLMETYAVVIHTTRDPLQVVPWLRGVHGISCRADDGEPRDFWNTPGVALVSRRKYPAVAYIDDRAIRFTDWDQALAELNIPKA
jgi:hypothetical protein